MRYYIRANGRLSSITVSDTLSQYLVLSQGGESDRYGRGKKYAQEWISGLAERFEVPTRDVSQWVQARIVDHIVRTELAEQLLKLRPTIDAKIESYASKRRL